MPKNDSRRVWRWILCLIGLPIAVLVAGSIYKRATGFTKFNEAAEHWLHPRQAAGFMPPLERKDLPEFRRDTHSVEGIPLPADWPARVVEADDRSFKLEVDLPTGTKATYFVDPVGDELQNSEFREQVEPLAVKFAGTWSAFAARFSSEREMLERIFDAELPPPASAILPLFPRPRDYQFELALLAAKSAIGNWRSLLLQGKNRFFFVGIDTLPRSEDKFMRVFHGPLSTRRVDCAMLVWGPEISESLIFDICGALDVGTFVPPLPKPPSTGLSAAGQ